MEQKYILKNSKSFRAKDVFECGQCFRWNIQEDGSYTGIFKSNVINVKEEKSSSGYDIIFEGICDGDIKEVCTNYFDLERDYEKIKEELSKVDENLRKAICYGAGIRILNQDLWETIISFIISANNNIPRIKKIIENISKKYGDEIIFRGNKYYTFPDPQSLAKATMEDLRNLGTGFRDKYIFETTNSILTNKISLDNLQQKETKKVREELLKLPGVGPKVADCILLFSNLSRFDVFPIDVWVRRVMNDLYIHNENEKNVKKQEIEKLAYEKFRNLEGLAQQYLFYWKRENNT